jgi:hypothetical protein
MEEDSMAWITLRNEQKIDKIISYFVDKQMDIEIEMGEEKSTYRSSFVTVDQEDISSRNGRKPGLIIAKMRPGSGNALIQSVPEVKIRFSVKEHVCRYQARYIGVSNISPWFGFIVSYPKSIQIKEKRKEPRITYEAPEMVSVEFKVGGGAKEDKLYRLNVRDQSKHGLGLLVTKKDFDLLQLVNVGDNLKNMLFFATSKLIRVRGTVRHKTKIEEGEHRGCYVVGVESPEIIENWKPK